MLEQEIQEVMADHQTKELAHTLISQVQRLPMPGRDDREAIHRILQDITGDLPVYQAMQVAFWLGCAWQNLTG